MFILVLVRSVIILHMVYFKDVREKATKKPRRLQTSHSSSVDSEGGASVQTQQEEVQEYLHKYEQLAENRRQFSCGCTRAEQTLTTHSDKQKQQRKMKATDESHQWQRSSGFQVGYKNVQKTTVWIQFRPIC